jgi:hypothetical protein
VGLVLALLGPVAAADPRAMLEYQVNDFDSGEPLHTVTGSTEPQPDGTVVARSTIVFPSGAVIDQRASFETGIPPRCIAWNWQATDAAGATIATNYGQCVPAGFPFLPRALPADAYPSYPPYALFGYVSTRLDLGQRQEASYHYLLMDTALVKIDVWVAGRERITVPAGEFDCYRVLMRPDVGSVYPDLPLMVRAVARFFVPTNTLWITVDAPQILVKFAGVMGPPRSPNVVARLVRISESSAAVTARN